MRATAQNAGRRVGPKGGSGTDGVVGGRPGSRQGTDGEGRTLMDRVRRLLRPVRLPIPPRPQGAPDFATTSRRQSLGWRSGPRRTRAVFVLLAGGALPRVRWAHESAGQESNLPCRNAWVTSRCRPTTATRGFGTDQRPRCGVRRDHRSHCWRSLQLSRSYMGATNQAFCANGSVTLAGAQGVEPRLRQVWKPPGYRCLAPLSCCPGFVSARKPKEPPPGGGGSRTVTDLRRSCSYVRKRPLGKEIKAHRLLAAGMRCDARRRQGDLPFDPPVIPARCHVVVPHASRVYGTPRHM